MYNSVMEPIISLLLGLLFAVQDPNPNPLVADRRREAECRRIEDQIRKIEARMRRPYSAAQGIRFDERLRELKEKRYQRCR